MTLLPGNGLPLLHLDYDGVLHPEDVWRHPRRGIHLGELSGTHKLFENAELLVSLLDPYPAVRVVLSTSWVRALGYSHAAKRLPRVLRDRVVGATFHSGMDATLFLQLSRGQQVVSDVGRRLPSAWLAIDDDYDAWPEAELHRLVATHPVMGIGAPPVLEELTTKLKTQFGRS